MSRRVVDLEHRCPNCSEWCEVWDDGEPDDYWTSCDCSAGYAPVAVIRRYRDAYLSELEPA